MNTEMVKPLKLHTCTQWSHSHHHSSYCIEKCMSLWRKICDECNEKFQVVQWLKRIQSMHRQKINNMLSSARTLNVWLNKQTTKQDICVAETCVARHVLFYSSNPSVWFKAFLFLLAGIAWKLRTQKAI